MKNDFVPMMMIVLLVAEVFVIRYWGHLGLILFGVVVFNFNAEIYDESACKAAGSKHGGAATLRIRESEGEPN